MMPAALFDFALFTNPQVFLLMTIVAMGAIGGMSGSSSMALITGYMTFVYIGSETTFTFYTNALYFILIALIMITGFRMYDAFVGGGS